MAEKSRLLITEDDSGRRTILDADMFNIYSGDVPPGSILIQGYELDIEMI